MPATQPDAAGYYAPAAHPDSTLTLFSLNQLFAPKHVAVPEGAAVVIGRLVDGVPDADHIPRFASRVVSRRHAIVSHTQGQVRRAAARRGNAVQGGPPTHSWRGRCGGFRGRRPQFYIQDAGSSSGTFLHEASSTDGRAFRLSESGQPSEPHALHHGDVISLGTWAEVDGGTARRRCGRG